MSEPVGIIYPPPDLKGIVDRTATYVAKNGSAFEARIMHEQKGKPKFSFLTIDDPFNAYYRHKVSEIRNSLLTTNDNKGSNTDDSHRSQQDDNQENKSEINTRDDQKIHLNKHDDGEHRAEGENEHETCDKTKTTDYPKDVPNDDSSTQCQVRPKLDEYIQEMTMKLEEPPLLHFLASPAPTITHLESEAIRLTAQYIAIYGRSFLLEVVTREQSNSLFDFLKPQHGQFPYMTNLVMQYALIQNPPLDIMEHLEKDACDQKYVLDRIKMRAEWNRMLEVEKRQKEEAEEREKELYNQIDWHDFVIVETVDYELGDKGEYPPTTADQVGTRLIKQQRLEDHTHPEEMEIDMDVESDSDLDDQITPSDVFEVPEAPDPSRVTIRRDYDPKMAAAKATTFGENYFVSPITNERIPAERMDEHFRYNLSDPRHLEKKEQMLQNKLNEETIFASGSQIQDSLKNLAERRTDIFGMNDSETAIGQRIGEDDEEQSKKGDKIIWDGHKSSLKKKRLN